MDNGQGNENAPSALEAGVRPKSLKDLRDDDRNDSQILLILESAFKSLLMEAADAVKEVSPGVGVDDHHLRVVRSDRQASTSPSHGSFPRRRRIARYSPPLSTRRRSAMATTSRLVRAPVRRMALSTSTSS